MHRTVVGFLAAAAAAMLNLQVSAADAPEPRPGPPGPPMMFQRMDRNQDHKITADEIPDGAPDFVKDMLKRADKDGDQTVTAEEFRNSLPTFPGAGPGRPEAGRPEAGPAGPGRFGPGAGRALPERPAVAGPDRPFPESRPDPQVLFKRLDKDGDQKLSVEEFAVGMKMFHARDAAGQRPPRMGREAMRMPGPMGPQSGMGRGPMMGPHPRMGKPPMMGPGGKGPQFGMGRGPMMGPRAGMGPGPMMGRPPFAPRGPMAHPGMPGARGPWGPQAWPQSPWARHTQGMRQGPMHGQAAAILARLQAADKDKDGKLSKSETPERLRQHFDKLDADKDGQLDKAELGKALAAKGQELRDAMAKRRAEMMKRMHEARDKAQEASKAHHDKPDVEKKQPDKHPVTKKPAPTKPGPKKPIDKKVLEKKSVEKKADEKKA